MGFETNANQPISSEKHAHCMAGAAKASVPLLPPMTADADLKKIINLWPDLPEAIRAAILTMVRAAKP